MKNKPHDIVVPPGFRFSGVHCGIKPADRDLAVVLADSECTAAGVYTQNLVRAASIDWNRRVTPTDRARCVVMNSGNANACTGVQGEKDNEQMAVVAAAEIGCAPSQVLVLSTGVIGQALPMSAIEPGVHQAIAVAKGDSDGFLAAADAIRTTDRFSKFDCQPVLLQEGPAGTILGVAKGAGMIGPNMATLLAILVTDCSLSPQQADELLRWSVNQSFNRISVEGHTSTNDACLLLGGSGPPLSDPADLEQFRRSLVTCMINLAKQIPADGEGASHLVQIRVVGAASDGPADQIARTVANSALVKTAVTGADPNWGRIVSAAGYAGVDFCLSETSLSIADHCVFRNGQPIPFSATEVSRCMAESDQVEIELRVGGGPGSAYHWTSDLTTDYVRLNSEYTT